MSIASAFVGYLLTIADWKDLWLQTGLVGYLANVSTKHSTGSETEYRYELYRSMQVASAVLCCGVVWCAWRVLTGGLSLGWHDFEDAVQAVCALEIEADYFVTRNPQDFSALSIPVVIPSDVLQSLKL